MNRNHLPNPNTFRYQPLTLAIALALTASPHLSQAAVRTWDGNGANDNWSYVNNIFNHSGSNYYLNTNWTANAACGIFTCNVPLASGDSLIFAGSLRLTPYNNLSSQSYTGLSFAADAGAFTLNGNAITSTGNISNNSSTRQTINMPIQTGADQTWDGGTAGMDINGVVNHGDYALTLKNHTSINNGSSFFFVGVSGSASLALQSGSTLSDQSGVVGDAYGSNGIATIDGIGSVWSNNNELIIGHHSGSGSLNIQNGGKVSNRDGYVGNNEESKGTVTVDGIGSAWINNLLLFIGYNGNGTLLIKNGGNVSDTSSYVGVNRISSNSTATVDGAGSMWSNSGDFNVGYYGNGSVTIKNGGKVNDIYGFVATQSSSTGTVTVNGSGSEWSSSLDLYVGHYGNGSLIIQNGGKVSNRDGYVGNEAGSVGSVTIEGIGSEWQNDANLFIGKFGNGALNIQNGGQVNNVVGLLGGTNGDTGIGIATVSGANSAWTNSGELFVGNFGSGILTVNKGGKVSNTIGYLGLYKGSIGTATVDGAGSKWDNSVFLSVGSGSNGTLTIQNGGQVSNTEGYLGASNIGTGTVTVDGIGSWWANSLSLFVGNDGNGTLTIQNGAQVSNTVGYVGKNSSGVGVTTVNGANSSWINSRDLAVGSSGHGTLNIQNGATVSNTDGFLGLDTGSNGTATVNGANSLWQNNGKLMVGNSGNGMLFIQNGGAVSNTDSSVGTQNGSTSYVNVTGENSQWTNNGQLAVGDNGNGSLVIMYAGKVNNTKGYLGKNTGSSGSATVYGAESAWTNSQELHVGYMGNGTLNILEGGKVSDLDGYTSFGFSSTVTVSGVNSLWDNSRYLYIGTYGNSTLTIQRGGSVRNFDGYLSVSDGSTATAIVDGKDSLWANRNDLYISHYGGFHNTGSGTLTIQNGGTVTVGNNLIIADQGKLVLNGGSLQAARAYTGSGRFDWIAGTLNLGEVTIGATDSLLGDVLTLDAKHILNVSSYANIANNAFVRLTGSDFQVGGDLANDGILNIGAGRSTKVANILTNTGSVINRGTLQGASINNSGSIQLAGNGKIVANTLNMNGGSITGSILDMNNIGKLSGYGTATTAITGGTAANTIQADGGMLVIGDGNSTSGFEFGGNLSVGGNQVTLLDKDKAHLGTATTLSNGGKLSTINGAELSNGETLSYSGNASILGDFTNNGAVAGFGGALTFLNDVNGAGSFSGDIVFHAAYNPGNSPAAIDFNGGNATYDSSSVLTIEIFGNTPGSEYDQLLNIDHLNFNGTLALVFGNHFTPTAGSYFNLFGFNQFSGSFAPDRITVTGLDRSLLDFSSLASNGRLQVAAVPLPAGAWLFGSGLAMLALARRKGV